MRSFILGATSLIGLALLAGPLSAQGRGRSAGIPPGHLPPPGECRVWHDDLPPGHQGPPTSCEAARREAYRTGGRVIYGGGEGRDERYDRGDRDRDRRDCERDRRRGDCDYYPADRFPDRYPDRDGYPRSLPEMVWGVIFGRGLAVDEIRQWVGSDAVRPRVEDADRNGTPEVVTWYDTTGRIMQRWIDDDRDGRADRVAYYDGGRVVRVVP